MPGTRNGSDRGLDLQRLAAPIVDAYARHAGLDAAYITGSVAHGWADRWSDLEIVLCWDRIPEEEARAELAGLARAASHRSFPREPGVSQADDELCLDGAKIDLIHMRTADLATILNDVTIEADETTSKHVVVAGIRDAVPVAGEVIVRAWRGQAATYPPVLRRAIILRNLVFGPHWWLEMLADRNDLLVLYQTLCRIEAAILNILLALNETYAPNESLKWSSHIARDLGVTPPNLATRLERVLLSTPHDGVFEARLLILETLNLIEAHMPEIDVTQVRARVCSPGRS